MCEDNIVIGLSWKKIGLDCGGNSIAKRA